MPDTNSTQPIVGFKPGIFTLKFLFAMPQPWYRFPSSKKDSHSKKTFKYKLDIKNQQKYQTDKGRLHEKLRNMKAESTP